MAIDAAPPPTSPATGSIVNEVFEVAWRIARRCAPPSKSLHRQPSAITSAVDQRFWQRVRHLAEQCRTPEDWERLLAVLLAISLDPRLDTAPLFAFSFGPDGDADGLRASCPRRRRYKLGAQPRSAAGTGSSSARRAADRRKLATNRAVKRSRLRAILDGAEEETKFELRALARWILDDAQARADGTPMSLWLRYCCALIEAWSEPPGDAQATDDELASERVALAAEMRQITNLIAKARADCALIAP